MPLFTKKSKVGGLVLNRKSGQTVYINHGEIIIEIVQIRGNLVRIAIKGNRNDISILRGELIATPKSQV